MTDFDQSKHEYGTVLRLEGETEYRIEISGDDAALAPHPDVTGFINNYEAGVTSAEWYLSGGETAATEWSYRGDLSLQLTNPDATRVEIRGETDVPTPPGDGKGVPGRVAALEEQVAGHEARVSAVDDRVSAVEKRLDENTGRIASLRELLGQWVGRGGA